MRLPFPAAKTIDAVVESSDNAILLGVGPISS